MPKFYKHVPKKLRYHPIPAKPYTIPDPNKAEKVKPHDAELRDKYVVPLDNYALPDEYREIRRKPD